MWELWLRSCRVLLTTSQFMACAKPAVLLLGSPRAIRRLHRLYMIESVASLPLMLIHMSLFILLTWRKLTTHEVVLMIAVVSVPVLLSGLRLPTLSKLDGISSSIADAYSLNEPVGERSLQLMWCRASQDQRLFSLLLTCWYSVGLAWQVRKPPCCVDDDFEPTHVLMMHCTAFRISSSVLAVTNATLCICSLVAPMVISRCADNFTPPRRRGIPQEILDRLPLYEVPARGEDAAMECVICFEPLEEGQSARQLPCRHDFHAECIDSWLSGKPCCPMRCSASLWDVLTDGDGSELVASASAGGAGPAVEPSTAAPAASREDGPFEPPHVAPQRSGVGRGDDATDPGGSGAEADVPRGTGAADIVSEDLSGAIVLDLEQPPEPSETATIIGRRCNVLSL